MFMIFFSADCLPFKLTPTTDQTTQIDLFNFKDSNDRPVGKSTHIRISVPDSDCTIVLLGSYIFLGTTLITILFEQRDLLHSTH